MRPLQHALLMLAALVLTISNAGAETALQTNEHASTDEAPRAALLAPLSLEPAWAASVDDADLVLAAVEPDLQLLSSTGPGTALELALTADLVYAGRLTKMTRTTPTRYTFRGTLDDSPGGVFVGAVVDDALAMSISLPDEQLYLMVRAIGDGAHVVYEPQQNNLPECGGGRQPRRPGAIAPPLGGATVPTATGISPPAPGTTNSVENGVCVAPDPVWDMVMLYTDDARAAVASDNGQPTNSHAPIQSLMQLFVEEANLTYENSGIQARLRVVYLGEVSYAESGLLATDLDRLTDGTNGLGVAHSLRTQYFADFVMLVLDEATDFCGLAWCCSGQDSAYATTRWGCGGRVFIHELGHNLGCAHDPGNTDCTGCFNDSRGHNWTGNDGMPYRSIMSTSGGRERVFHFSNPNVNFLGQPTGISGARDNVRTINFRRFFYEQMRPSRFQVWVDLNDFLGPFLGTFNDPYISISDAQNLLIEGVNPSEPPTMYIKAGSTAFQTPTLNKPMMVRACGGTVTIGQ